MSIIQPTKKPLYYTVVYVTPPNHNDRQSEKNKVSDSNFLDTASIAIAMATNELGYTGFETEKSADGRVARVCYWDSYTQMAIQASGQLIPIPLLPMMTVRGS